MRAMPLRLSPPLFNEGEDMTDYSSTARIHSGAPVGSWSEEASIRSIPCNEPMTLSRQGALAFVAR